ncbi:hypothetical protein MJO52_08945 [Microbulbifer variabilis]|uniref:Fibronectin type-III domain-containing protein n=1 Tax=Microbulbifer variabilis TaxID=266805 RepID=A0ABY4VGN1_9GAMM|nr:RHS repeat-associated core domain-containing protein [Microbulbifer variabilis]USD23247.1 hypothetical protein MJO52_08945 [Microbulbifer variabilis]
MSRDWKAIFSIFTFVFFYFSFSGLALAGVISGTTNSSTGTVKLTYSKISPASKAEFRIYKSGSLYRTYSVSPSGGTKTYNLGTGTYRFDLWAGNECLQWGRNGHCYEPGFFFKRGSHTVKVSIAGPGAVTLPKTSKTGGFKVSWGKASKTPGKYILWERKNGGAWSDIYSGGGLSKTLAGRSTGKYEYRVQACFTACSSYVYSQAITVARTPTSVTVPSKSTNGSVAISWNAGSGASKYILQEKKNSGSWVEVYKGNLTKKTLTGRGTGIYSYRVAVIQGSLTSSYKTSSNVTVSRAPGVPKNLVVPGNDSNGVYKISWDSVSGASRYKVEQTGDATGSWSQTGLSKTFTKTKNGSYSYRVRACKTYNKVESCSGWTSKKTINLKLPNIALQSVSKSGKVTLVFNTDWPRAERCELKRDNVKVSSAKFSSGAIFSETLSASGTYSYRYSCQTCLLGSFPNCPEPDFAGYASVSATVVIVPNKATLSIKNNKSYNGNASLKSHSTGPISSVRWQKRKKGTVWPSDSSYSTAGAVDFTATGLTDGSWEFRSKNCNSSGCSVSWSATVGITVWNQPLPSAPVLDSIANSSNGSISLNWSDRSNEFVYQYKIYEGGKFLKTVSTSSTSPSKVTGTQLKRNDGVYKYHLVACNLRGCSGTGNSKSVIVAKKPGKPNSLNLSPLFSRTGSVDLNWGSSSGNLVRYEIFSGTATSVDGTVSWNNSTVIKHTNLDNLSKSFSLDGGFFAYKIRACNQVSSFSSCSATAVTEVVQVELSSPPVSVDTPPHKATALANTDPAVLASDRVGIVPGEFRVSESGAATYSLPIPVGPSSGSSVPSVSVSYSSSGGHGPLGVGWGISGLSAITACRKSFEEDGVNGSQFDRFCLDGLRLKLVSSGQYGGIGTQYRTSLDSFVRVKVVSTGVGSKKGFEVYRKDGSISYYGLTDDSQSTNAWYINKQADSVGNRIEYSYLKDSNVGEHLIEYIDYSGGSNDILVNRIEFNYDTNRSDKRYGYRFGQKSASTRRLTSIISTAESEEIRRYKFSYKKSGTGRLLLEEVEECVKSNCRKPTVFTYSKSDGAGLVKGLANPNIFHSGFEGGKYGDVNGDGLTDFVFIRYDGSHGKRYIRVALGTKQGSLAIQPGQMRIRSNEREEWHLLDYNNDGKDDLLHAPISDSSTYWEVNYSNGSGFSVTDTPTAITFQKGQLGKMHDFNADGLPDYIYFTGGNADHFRSQSPNLKIRELQRSSSGKLSFKNSEVVRSLSLPSSTPPGGRTGLYINRTNVNVRDKDIVADFNGDGIADLTAIVSTNWRCTEPSIDCYNDITSRTDYHFVVLMSNVNGGHSTVFSRQIFNSGGSTEHMVSDLNGDGLPDLLFRGSNKSAWSVYHFNGVKFITAKALPAIVDDNIQLYDWDMDGLVDILYPNANDKINNEYQYLYVLPNKSNGFGTGVKTGLILGVDKSDHSHYIMDVTGDGRPEIVEKCANRDEKENHCDDMRTRSGFFSGSGFTDKYVRILKPKHGNKPVDILESVENGFGVRTEIQYARLNDDSANIYNRKKGSFKLNYGRGSPVFDLYSPMYVVKKVISDAPAANDNNNTVEAHYHYAGARMQSGGRGFLGFESVTTYDPQNKVKITTRYRQDYPYIGMPSQTAKVIEPNASNIKTPASCSESSLKLISCSINTLKSVEPVSGKTVMPYISQAQDKSYSLDGHYLGKVVTTTNYTADVDIKYGNVSSVVVKNYDASNNLVQSKTTSNKYNNVVSSSRWHLARLSESSVTTQRQGSLAAPQIKRTVHFGYDGQTGLLTDEWVAKGSVEELHTRYEHDRFGNRIAATVTDALGQSRTSHTGYDSYGRFPTSKTNALSQTVEQYLGMDAFGQPSKVFDISGVATTYAYSQFGTRYFEHHETGSHSTTLSTFCADSGGCPTVAGIPAHFKVTTTGIDKTKTVMYHDRLGREIRKQTQDFHGKSVFVDTQYDVQSRVKKISDPYKSGSSPRWTSYSYDILGRTTKVDAPSGQCDSTITYNGLRETTKNCAQQTKVTQKNVLGELAQVTDNIGGKLKYEYFADGNLRHVRVLNSGGGETSVTSIEYDNLGRKKRLVDPDKGTWTYGYNGFGELAWQKDAKGQGTTMTYDALGRMVTRADYTSFNSSSQTGKLQNFSRWYYDQDPGCNSKYRFDGKLVAVAQASVVINGSCNTNMEDISFLKLMHYDIYGRLGETTTVLGVLDGEGDFYEKVTYDKYSRVKRSFDASNQQVARQQNYLYGMETVYNSYGYKVGVRDVKAPAGQGYYYRVKRMNLRGQVEEVLLGNGLTTTYEYHPQHYRLTSILTDINPGVGQVQNLHYDWNAIGNLLSKTDLSGDGSYSKDLQESFEYDGLNRLRYARLYSGGSEASVQEVRYNDAGNIRFKSGVGNYSYDSARPHAVTKAGSLSYEYDENGNMVRGSNNRIREYTVFDKPSLLTKDSHKTRLYYGPDRSRFKRVDDNGKGTVTTLQIGSVEKVIERSTSGAHIKSFYRRNIAGVAVERVQLNASDEIAGTSTQYLHKDLQGSLDVITDSKGQVAEDAAGNKLLYSFDAWGKRRNPLNWERIGSGPSNTVKTLNVGAFNHLSSNRGYTGHEMMDEVGLIHMNGRVYDPNLSRFLTADPIIDGITSVQGYNRYAYVHNNPLTYTDPSGYSSWNKWRDSVVKPVVAVVIAIYTGGQALAALNTAQGLTAAAAASAAQGMTANAFMYLTAANSAMASAVGWAAIGGAIAGGLNGGARGAFVGAFTSVASMGIGQAFQAGRSIGHTAANITSHALMGGVGATLGGGKFAHGFLSAGFNGIAKLGVSMIPGEGFSPLRVSAMAVVGGTISNTTGGKFVNGAVTGAIQQAFNGEFSRDNHRFWKVKLEKSLMVDGEIPKSCSWMAVCNATFLEDSLHVEPDGSIGPLSDGENTKLGVFACGISSCSSEAEIEVHFLRAMVTKFQIERKGVNPSLVLYGQNDVRISLNQTGVRYEPFVVTDFNYHKFNHFSGQLGLGDMLNELAND